VLLALSRPHFYLSCLFFFFIMIWPPPRSTLFPYTTLFRSAQTLLVSPIPIPMVALFFAKSTPLDFTPLTDFQANSKSDLSSSVRSEEHTSELQSRFDLVCRLLLEKKNIDMIL